MVVPRTVDAYIAAAPAIAKPVLRHVRTLIHEACPDVIETIKWGRPFFLHRSALLCNVAAFTGHCSFGFWGESMGAVLRADGINSDGSSGSFGRLEGLSDLLSKNVLIAYVRRAVTLVEAGGRKAGAVRIAKSKPARKAPKKELRVPAELAAALGMNKKAAKAFEAFSPSHRREYIEWIEEAKREVTRLSRVATAITWLAEEKSRHWKYQA